MGVTMTKSSIGMMAGVNLAAAMSVAFSAPYGSGRQYYDEPELTPEEIEREQERLRQLREQETRRWQEQQMRGALHKAKAELKRQRKAEKLQAAWDKQQGNKA